MCVEIVEYLTINVSTSIIIIRKKYSQTLTNMYK